MNRPLFLIAGLMLLGTLSGRAESAPRALSLNDCVSLALSNNLDLRVERYQPEIALYDLRAAQAGFEPLFDVGGEHGHSEEGDRLLEGGFIIPGSESDNNSFSGGLNGLLPWTGTRYDLSATARDSYGNSFFLDTNNMVVASPFESARATAAITVTQPLLKNFWIDSTRLRIAVAKNRLQYSQYGFQQRVIDTINTVEQNYYDLKFANETVLVQEKALELAQRLLDENRKRVEVGTLAPLDEKQAESEVSARQADLLSAQRNLAIQENALKRLLSDDFAGWNDIRLELSERLDVTRPVFNLQDSWSRGLSERPDYLQAKLDLERQGIQLKFDRNQLYPQLDVFGTYGYSGNADEFGGAFREISDRDRPFYSFGGRFSIPLGNGAARNNYRASKAVYEQALLLFKRLEQEIMVQIDNAIKLAQASYERVEATRKASEYAAEALAAEQKKLENGKSTSFVVLQLQRDLTTARSEEVRAVAEYNKSLANLSRAEGTTLERRGIDLEIK